MAQYPAGPYTIEIPYIVDGFTHALEYNCDVVGSVSTGQNPAAITLESQSGIGVNLQVAVDALWGVMRPFFQNITLAAAYTLWKHNPDNTEKLYISAGTLTAPNGTEPGAYEKAGLIILTWRSAGGNIMKVTMIEPTTTARKDRVPLVSAADGRVTALNTYIMSNDNVIMARDRTFPVAPMNASFGQHEATYRRRFRS